MQSQPQLCTQVDLEQKEAELSEADALLNVAAKEIGQRIKLPPAVPESPPGPVSPSNGKHAGETERARGGLFAGLNMRWHE